MSDDFDQQRAAAQAATDQVEAHMLDTLGPAAARIEASLVKSGCSQALALHLTLALIGPHIAEGMKP